LKKGIIEIEDMEFFAFHGCFKEEKIVGNNFLVDLTIETDVSLASESDNIHDALNYQTAYEVVKDQMAISSNLLEHVCQRILDALYVHFSSQIIKAKVKVRKMNPPMGGKMRSVSLTFEQ